MHRTHHRAIYRYAALDPVSLMWHARQNCIWSLPAELGHYHFLRWIRSCNSAYQACVNHAATATSFKSQIQPDLCPWELVNHGSAPLNSFYYVAWMRSGWEMEVARSPLIDFEPYEQYAVQAVLAAGKSQVTVRCIRVRWRLWLEDERDDHANKMFSFSWQGRILICSYCSYAGGHRKLPDSHTVLVCSTYHVPCRAWNAY